MSVGHIYRYFANKEAMVAALVEQDLDDAIADIETLSGPPDEIARRILAHVERSRSRPRLSLWLEMMAEGARNPTIAALLTDFDRRVRDRLRNALAHACTGQGRPDDMATEEIETRMSLIGVLIDGLQVRTFLQGDALPEDVRDRVLGLLTQTLSPAPMTSGAAS